VINLYPWMKVHEYVQYTASFYARWNDQLASRLMNEWDLHADDRIGTLSVGTLQKLAILTAVGHEPDLLILDEPPPVSIHWPAAVSATDRRSRRARSSQRAVLDAHHFDLERIADTVAVLGDGRITHFGPMEELKAQTHLNLEDAFLEMIHE